LAGDCILRLAVVCCAVGLQGRIEIVSLETRNPEPYWGRTTNQRSQLEARVQRWTEAGLIDAPTAARILGFEAGQERGATLRWPVLLAMIFGGILSAAGVTLFVAAHWSELSPTIRFSLMILVTGVFHIGGAVLADRFPPLSTTLHAVGTATLGAAIFLSAQIFNLHENWATGVLLWAVGTAFGYILLRDWSQAALLALLTPAWLISQWTITTEWHSGGDRPLTLGLVLTAFCYLSARIGEQENMARRTLVWIGGIALLPCVGIAIVTATEASTSWNRDRSSLPFATLLAGWTVALAAPLILSWSLRGSAVWVNFLWAAWAYALILAASYSHRLGRDGYHRNLGATVALYGLCALGSVGLVAWGLNEKRKERVNLGIAGFAISVLFFYFDSFMDKLGRSASLLILGILCLLGGYALEVTRRRLMARMEMSR
jgi:MFS family permease